MVKQFIQAGMEAREKMMVQLVFVDANSHHVCAACSHERWQIVFVLLDNIRCFEKRRGEGVEGGEP